MYGREYNGQVLSFEASGALKEAALIMRDRETNSWWSIMSGDAIGGALEGVDLIELPVGEKTTWGDWLNRYPETRVLSVDGEEYGGRNPYSAYYEGETTFRGTAVKDGRLAGKESIYSFRHKGHPYAVTQAAIEGGAVFDIDGGQAFFYRTEGASLFESTRAYFLATEDGSQRIQHTANKWLDAGTGAIFDVRTGFPDMNAEGAGKGGSMAPPVKLSGFDTFWYVWSNIHAHTTILSG